MHLLVLKKKYGGSFNVHLVWGETRLTWLIASPWLMGRVSFLVCARTIPICCRAMFHKKPFPHESYESHDRKRGLHINLFEADFACFGSPYDSEIGDS